MGELNNTHVPIYNEAMPPHSASTPQKSIPDTSQLGNFNGKFNGKFNGFHYLNKCLAAAYVSAVSATTSTLPFC
jgi:hypothetical protein